MGNYIQPLWETVMPVTGGSHLYNGVVEALTTLGGASLSFALGYVHLNWKLIGEPVMFLTSAVGGLVLVVMAKTESIWVAYAGYVVFRAFYQMMITVARLRFTTAMTFSGRPFTHRLPVLQL